MRRNAYPKLSIQQNFSRVFIGDCVYAIAAWLMLVVLIKLGSESLVGIYALGVAISVPVNTLTNLGLTGGLFTDSSKRCPYGRYLALRLLTSVVSVLVVGGIVFAIDYSPIERTVVILVAVSTAIAAFREILLTIMRRAECMNLVGTSQCIAAGAVLAAFTASFWPGRSLPWAVVAMCSARLGVLALFDLRHVHGLVRAREDAEVTLEWSWRPLVKLGMTTAPLAIAMALASLTPNIPRFLLERFHGEEVLGFFAAMAAIATFGTRMMNGLGTAVTPRLVHGFTENRSAYHRLTMKLLAFGLVMGAVVILAALLVGRTILTLVFTDDFAALNSEFILLMVYLAVMFLVYLINQALVASRAFTRISLVNAGVCLASLVFSWWLIPSGGLRGACWAMIAMSACWFALLAAVYVARVRTANVA
jgi:O-antigen/teichoic acid export membrane protein